MFKVNTRNTGKMCKIYSKLKIKTRTRRQWHLFGIFIVNFDHILHPFLLFLLHTLGQNEHTMSANHVLIFNRQNVTILPQKLFTHFGMPYRPKNQSHTTNKGNEVGKQESDVPYVQCKNFLLNILQLQSILYCILGIVFQHPFYDAFRDLIPFAQFKKREKHPWRSVIFSN